jgi:hypothetical protein
VGLFGTKDAAAPVRRAARVLKASGMRMKTGNQETVRAVAATRQTWQSDAWGYRDMIGELRFGVQFRSRAVSKVKFFPAQAVPGEDEPIPLDAEKGVTVPAALRKAAAEEMARLPLDSGYAFSGILDENLGITGEAWLHGHMVNGEERWDVRSVDEVDAGSDGRMYLREYGMATRTPVDPEAEEMLRLWVPHPRYKILADSPMRSLLSVCEELILAGREMRAASRSRFAANGVLLVPDGMTLLNAVKEDSSLVDDNDFMADLVATLLAPINNEGDPGSVVPAVISGDIEDIKAVRHLRMEREDSAALLDKIDRGLARLGRGLDIPPEILTGMAAANHWTAWQIDASTYRNHIDPGVRTIADSLTEAFLRPALLARGFTPEQVMLVQVWYDAGAVTENPNRVQDAKDAYDRGAIGMDPLRQALGFNEADAPDDEEVLKMVAFKIGIDPATAGILLQTLFGRKPADIVTTSTPEADKGDVVEGEVVPPELPAGQQNPGQAPPGTADTATPSVGAQKLLSYLLADAAPVDEPDDGSWVIDDVAGRKLMEIDRALRDKLLAAANSAAERGLEKAGARIRSKAQKNAATRLLVAQFASEELGAKLGRDNVHELGLDEEGLIGDSIDGLEEKFTRWVNASIEATIGVVLALLGLKPDSDKGKTLADRLRTGMSGRITSGWALFRDGLMAAAEKYLYDPHPDQEPGEVPDGMVNPGLVRGVLAHVGGTDGKTTSADEEGFPEKADRPVGGVALGDEVDQVLTEEGVEELGFEWAYGITPVAHFEPHKELDGQRFSSWKDERLIPDAKYAWVGAIFQPGDHKGCMCDYVPSYARQEYGEILADRLDVETPNARDDRLLAEGDDAAGRTGTTAQEARDERNRILALQDRWIKAGKENR